MAGHNGQRKWKALKIYNNAWFIQNIKIALGLLCNIPRGTHPTNASIVINFFPEIFDLPSISLFGRMSMLWKTRSKKL